MCGIAGIISFSGMGEREVDAAHSMNRILAHRGPDDQGVEILPHCVLAHRRLAIIDLSSDGHQPFVSEDRRFYMLFNGEIFNYIELRQELEELGIKCRTKTDTEVLLQAYAKWGASCLNRFNGMFAFVIYDTHHHSFFLARDRFGIKPLYYSMQGDAMYFASEIKALLAVLPHRPSLHYQSVLDFTVFGRTDVFDETFVNEVKRIPKGHFAHFTREGLSLTRWWNPFYYIDRHHDVSFDQACTKLRELMCSSVHLRMRSDVQVGSCLSGGLDSSILLGILGESNLLSDAYATFTATFPGDALDESSYVDLLKEQWGFANYRTCPTAESAYEHLREFTYSADEPTLNCSFYSQYEVMRLAGEKGVKVLLDGQGGDENFAGYQYFHGFNMFGLLSHAKVLAFAGEMLRSLLRSQHPLAYKTLAFQLLPSFARARMLHQKASYLSRDFFEPHVKASRIFNEFFSARTVNESIAQHFQYKLEHLLKIEDRNSMRFSIEARVPYLDYRLVEFVLGLPGDFKTRIGETKFIQKHALGKYTIPEILNRRDKIGFGTPAEKWLAKEVWRTKIQKHLSALREQMPDIFNERVTRVSTAADSWRLLQLSLWSEIFNVRT